MLVAVSDNRSYCTLLMDSFGVDEDEAWEIEPDIYICAREPYVRQVRFVTSRLKWFLTRLRPVRLSCLDYAFSVKQAGV